MERLVSACPMYVVKYGECLSYDSAYLQYSTCFLLTTRDRGNFTHSLSPSLSLPYQVGRPDAVSRKLLSGAVFYVVPNMCPGEARVGTKNILTSRVVFRHTQPADSYPD